MRKLTEALFFLILFCGCRKEIPLVLEADKDQIVIEATIGASTVPRVVISKTQSVFSGNYYSSGVSNAMVYITNNRGQKTDFYLSDELSGEYSQDYYRRDFFQIESGITYTLHVQIKDKVYTATSKMPNQVRLEKVKVSASPLTFGGTINYALTPIYTDPKGEKNFYRFIFKSVGGTDPNIYLLNDNQTDGLVNNISLLSLNALYYGQNLTVEMQSIDEATYDYFYQLRQNSLLGQAGGPTPSDPPGNIKGGALGYFSAYSTSEIRVKIR